MGMEGIAPSMPGRAAYHGSDGALPSIRCASVGMTRALFKLNRYAQFSLHRACVCVTEPVP